MKGTLSEPLRPPAGSRLSANPNDAASCCTRWCPLAGRLRRLVVFDDALPPPPMARCPSVAHHHGAAEHNVYLLAARHMPKYQERIKGYVPLWSYDAELAANPHAADGGGVTTAVTWGFVGVAVLWGFFACFTALAWRFTACASDGGGTGLALVPDWLMALYLPFLASELYIEFRVLRILVVAQAMRTAPFRLLTVPLRYRSWLLFVFLVSAACHMDIASTGLVAAKALRTGSCLTNAARNPTTIWRAVIQQSFLRRVPGADNFTLVFAAAIAVILLQPLHALLCTVRVGGRGLKHYTYNTLLLSNQDSHGAAMILATVNRMAAATWQDSSYLSSISTSWPLLDIVTHMQRLVGQFALMGCSETALQINVQTSLLAIGMADARGRNGGERARPDLLTVSSIVLTGLTAAYTLSQIVVKVLELTHSAKVAYHHAHEAELNARKSRMEPGAGPRGRARATLQEGIRAPLWQSKMMQKQEEAAHRSADDLLAQVGRNYKVFWLFVAFYSSLVTYALVKLAMAFVCEDSVWNITGCVDLSVLDKDAIGGNATVGV